MPATTCEKVQAFFSRRAMAAGGHGAFAGLYPNSLVRLQTTGNGFATVNPLSASSLSVLRGQPSLNAVRSAGRECSNTPDPLTISNLWS